MIPIIGTYLILGLLLLASPAMGALKVEDCLDCHEDYKAFVHGSVSCTDCHADITELPHKEKLKKPACGECHETVQTAFSNSIHGKQEMRVQRVPRCALCKQGDEILRFVSCGRPAQISSRERHTFDTAAMCCLPLLRYIQ